MRTCNEFFSVDITEFPGMVPGIGSSKAGTTLDILSSAMRPDWTAFGAGSKGMRGPTISLGPTPELGGVSLEDLETRYQVACEVREHASAHLREALTRHFRSSSRADTSTRATSRASGLSASRASTRLSSNMDFTSERAWPSSSSRPASRIEERPADFVPAVWPFPEPIPHEAPEWRPPSQPLPVVTSHELSAERHSERRRTTVQPLSGRLMSSVSGRERRNLIENDDFIAAHRDLANSWISACKPDTWIPKGKEELWQMVGKERREGCRQRAKMLANMERLPFNEWLKDVEEVERALKQEQSDNPFELHVSDEAAHAHEVLQKMSNDANRGLISRHDREVAQQMALTNVRRHWPKGNDKDNMMKGFEQLAAEVRQGVCTLGESKGTIVRIVALINLRVEKKGHILAELGSWKRDRGSPMIRLPSLKQTHFEKVEDTMQRALKSCLLPFAPGFEMGNLTFSEYTGKSEAYGMATVFHKSFQCASIQEDFGDPVLPIVATSVKDIPHYLQKYVVFCLRHQSKIRLYTWMKPDDFDYLSNSPQGKDDMTQWFKAMTMDEQWALDALSWTCDGLSDERAGILKVRPSLLKDIKLKFKVSKDDERKSKEACNIGLLPRHSVRQVPTQVVDEQEKPDKPVSKPVEGNRRRTVAAMDQSRRRTVSPRPAGKSSSRQGQTADAFTKVAASRAEDELSD